MNDKENKLNTLKQEALASFLEFSESVIEAFEARNITLAVTAPKIFEIISSITKLENINEIRAVSGKLRYLITVFDFRGLDVHSIPKVRDNLLKFENKLTALHTELNPLNYRA